MPETDNAIFVSTGDCELDKLLAADKKEGGLRAGVLSHDGRGLRETPIVLIEGGAGVGKTTLALQIGANVAQREERSRGRDWAVVFLSLEQAAVSLMNVVENFGFGVRGNRKTFIDLSTESKQEPKFPQKVHLLRLSPLPLTDQRPEATFETRFAELENILTKQADQSRRVSYFSFYIIDSLNALTGAPLSRSQIYQLFSLFRAKHVPLVATLEKSERMSSAGATMFQTERFLADIVITLSREVRKDYLQSFLEVTKSRVCRQGFGRHLYKTRTINNAAEVGAPQRRGLVVYPSVHFIISQARRSPVPLPSQPDFSMARELKTLLPESRIKRPACFAVVGAPGTHKLALGLNLSAGYVGRKANVLIVTFGGQGEIDFSGVAWVGSRGYLRGLRCNARRKQGVRNGIQPLDAFSPRGTKSYMQTYYADEGSQSASVTVLYFQIGVLTPEECLYTIRETLEAAQQQKAFRSVLLCDTAELCTGFPLLSSDPMFFPALLDLFEAKGVVTVGIGVSGSEDPHLRALNLALTAKATHRVILSHFPKVEKLMGDMVTSQQQDAGAQHYAGKPLQEQLVSVVIDNVTGKHYKRQPKWIRAHEIEGKPKALYFDDFDKPPINPSGSTKDDSRRMLRRRPRSR